MINKNFKTKTIQLSDGRTITIETGKLAKQADGSVVVKMGKTMLLATVVSKEEAGENVDFLPLSVDYQEKFASTGRIPGGFMKREGKLSDYEVLISRLVDRAIRPLFPDDYHADTQINIQLISAEEGSQPDALAALAASSALMVSDIPFNGPIAEVRVIKIGSEYKINPSQEEMRGATIDLIVAASIENILMVEGEMSEASEEDMLEAIKFAHEEIKILCKAQKEFEQEVGSTEKRVYCHEKQDPELKKKIQELFYDAIYQIAKQNIADKKLRSQAMDQLKKNYIEALPEDHEEDLFLINSYFSSVKKQASRDYVLKEKIRIDGRKPDEIRSIWSEVDYLPAAHGSALFTRGETQSLTTVTLGTKLDEKMIDGALFTGTHSFMLHYNFPSFSTGEVRPNRGPGRREVGHGNLAQRALKEVVPTKDQFPYTIRIVSDILESNGSSSMATVCAGTLALMDCGVPIKSPVSGIAMGMISDSTSGNYVILSDILGDEDHLGDMDFKVTGTEKGITACQMDIKIDGLSYQVLAEALQQAKEGRLHILNKMKESMTEPRADLKSHTPRSEMIEISKDMIGAVIGPGGKVVQEIQAESGTTIVIEEKDNTAFVNIFSADEKSMQIAVGRVKQIVAVPTIGDVYNGKVKSILPFGAFVEFMPGKDGLLHISEIKWERVDKMDGILEVGEEIQIKLIDVDKKTGKYRLSRKVLLPKPEKAKSE